MNSISQCPECQEWVSLPPVADRNARTRCPLCDAEYLLEDALKNSPPELILLDLPEDASLVETSILPQESDQNPNDEGLDLRLIGPAAEQGPLEAPVFHQDSQGDTQGTRARRPTNGASPLRLIRNVVLGGFAGLALGYFVLLWIAGPTADFLGLGAKLPKILLPDSFDE